MTSPLYLTWQFDPVLVGGLVTLAVCYGLAVGPLRSRLAPNEHVPTGKVVWFFSGVIVLFLVEGSPLHDLAERYLFSAHMLQHLLISYLVAPIILWGLPSWVLRPLLLNRVVKPVARSITTPLSTFFLFNFFFSVWHLPTIYEGALANSTLHHSEHFIFLLSSLLLWWPLMSPLSELPRPTYLVQLVYLFLIPIAQLPVFAAVTFADTALYPTYVEAPRLFFRTALIDQAVGGALMKVISLFAFGIPFIVIFFRWYRSENVRSRPLEARS
ncbi:MAG: cytochrome c oxidase assembly protein [Trueperaceae bacterium]|nr:MAG: cytochrome c oxidase assembly protein [Trueperaceae bacterium]